MFFIQMSKVSGGNVICAGIPSDALFGVPICNVNDVGAAEGSKFRTMRLGNNLSIVVMQHEELDGPRFEEKLHPLQHKSFFSGFNDANTDNSKMSSTNAAEATQWTRNATLSYGVGGSFSSSDVLSYAAGSAIAGGGARIQVGAVASGGGGDTNTPTGSASNRLGLSTDRAAGPSLGGSSVGISGGGVGHSSLLGLGGGAGGLGGVGGGAGGGPSASGGVSGDKNASASGVINGVPLDPTIHEDPLVHWNHMGMFQNVSVDLKPSLKAHLTETIYGLTDPRNEVGGTPCPYATMYYHNALSEIAKETFYLGEEHEEFIARQRQRHPRQGAPNPSSPTAGNSGGGGLTSTNSSDWDFVMGNSTANASGAVIAQHALSSGGSNSNNQHAAAALTSTPSRASGASADLARSPTADEPHSHSFAGQTPNRTDSSRDGGDLPPPTPTRAAAPAATVTYAPSAPPSISLSAPPAIEREAQDVENALETIKADIAYITVGSDMGYSTTTLLRVAAILSEVAVFLGYPNNEQHLRTVATYIRKLMLEGNLSFLEQSRERLQKSGAAATAQLDGLLREATTLFGDQLAEEGDVNSGGAASGKRGSDGAQPRHPLYGTIMLGDRLVAETSPNFANDSLRWNSQSAASSRGAELWASDKYIVQLISAAYYSFTTLVGDLVSPREWRIRKLEEGLAKFGINRNNVMKPKSRAFMVKYLQMLSAASPVAPSAPENVLASSPSHHPHQPTQHTDDGDASSPLDLGRGTSEQREASQASVSSAASSSAYGAVAGEATSSPSAPHYGTALRFGTNPSPVPKSDKASEEDASSIYTCYFDELLRLCDVNERIDESEDSSDEEEEGAGGFLGSGGDEGSGAFGRSRLSSVAVGQSNNSSGEKDDFMGSTSAPESPPQHTLGAPRHTQGGHYHYGAFQTRGSTLMIGTSEREDRRPSTNARHSIYDPRSSNLSAFGGGGNSARKSGQLLVLDDTLREAMGSRNLRASMRLAASRSGDIVQLNASVNIGNNSAMANALAASLLQTPPLSLKKSLRLAKTSRKIIENIVPKCPPYHDACRFLPPVRSGEVHGFAPDLSSLDRPDVLYTAVIEGVLLRGYPDRTTVLQLDFFNAPDDQMDGEEIGGSECPSGYSVAFLYAGLTEGDYDEDDGSDDGNGGAGEKAAELGRLQLLNDKALEGVYYMTYNAFRADLYRAMWLTSPTVDSYGVPGLIHFACVDRRQNNCVAANFDAAIRNATDTDVKLGNRMLHEIMAQSISKAHELMAMGFSEGLWGHLGVQFFYCVGLMPSDSRLMVQQQAASANVSNLTSRAGSPEAINPYGASSAGGAFGAAGLMSGALGAGFGSLGGGGGVGGSHGGGGSKMLRRAARGNFNRSHYTQSVFVDAQTFNNAFNNSSFAGSVYSNNNVPSGRPSLALDVSQARGTLLFPERSKLPLAAVQNLLYRPYLIPDKSEAAVLEFYGLFVGAMSPSEVCDSVELLLGKIFE